MFKLPYRSQKTLPPVAVIVYDNETFEVYGPANDPNCQNTYTFLMEKLGGINDSVGPGNYIFDVVWYLGIIPATRLLPASDQDLIDLQ